MKSIVVVVIGMIAFHNSIVAQDCSQTLRLARSTYEQGRLRDLPELLKKCLAGSGSTSFTTQEKVEAYKLLTLSYIYLEEPERADSSMLLLLRTDPYFELNRVADPQEFIGLYNTFRTDPIYRIGPKAGAIITQPNVTNSNFVNGGTSKYETKIGILVGVFLEIPVLKKFILNPEIYIQNKTFGLANSHSTIATTNSTESQIWVSLPISLQHEIFKEKFKAKKIKILPYVSAGLQTDYLISSSINVATNKDNQLPVPPKSIDITNNRNSINVSAIASVGAKIKIGPGFLNGEARFAYGLKNLVKTEDVYANSSTVFDNYIVDGIFKLNSFSFTVGYAYNIFKPKKRKG
jgi:Outer membrane protein beta-barrel domain